MATIDGKSIAGLFEQIGWTCEVVDERTVITGYRCPIPGYYYALLIEVRSTPHWVYLRALLQRGVSPAARVPMLRFISHLNTQSRHAKFLLIQDCVVLQTETPATQWHLGTFQEQLHAVCRFGSQAGVEVAILATDLGVSELFDSVQRRADELGGGAGSAPAEQDLDFDISVNRIQHWSNVPEGDA